MLRHYLINGFVDNINEFRSVVNYIRVSQGVRLIVSAVIDKYGDCMGGFGVNIVILADDETWRGYCEPSLSQVVDTSINEVYTDECFGD